MQISKFISKYFKEKRSKYWVFIIFLTGISFTNSLNIKQTRVIKIIIFYCLKYVGKIIIKCVRTSFSLKSIVDSLEIYSCIKFHEVWMNAPWTLQTAVFVPNFHFCLLAINIETSSLHVKTVNQTLK